MILKRVPTMGISFVELEVMAGTTALGLLAIKNNISAFMYLLSMYEHTASALNATDLYGNTSQHYFALRGDERRPLLAHMAEMGADLAAVNNADEEPCVVLADRKVSCREKGERVGASFCAVRLLISMFE
jgi:hypothetical protein